MIAAKGPVHTSVGLCGLVFFFFSSRRRHTRLQGDWSSDVCSSDLLEGLGGGATGAADLLTWGAVRSPMAARFGVFIGPRRRLVPSSILLTDAAVRSEERRVGKEGRSRWSPYHLKKKK